MIDDQTLSGGRASRALRERFSKSVMRTTMRRFGVCPPTFETAPMSCHAPCAYHMAHHGPTTGQYVRDSRDDHRRVLTSDRTARSGKVASAPWRRNPTTYAAASIALRETPQPTRSSVRRLCCSPRRDGTSPADAPEAPRANRRNVPKARSSRVA